MAVAERLITKADFVGVPTRDLERSVDFYGNTLGLERSVYNPERRFAEFEVGNLTLSIYAPEDMGLEFHLNRNPIALHVNDMDTARTTLTKAGVEFTGDPLDTGVCFMSFFADPDGNALMLHHRYAPRHPQG
jgi:predicted enzyme related to lactoylglutathione lyase